MSLTERERTRAVVTQSDLVTDLNGALARNELRVHYLPMVSLEARRVEGVEALVRWDRGHVVLDARRFLDLAERTGQIVPIGRWTMAVACEDVARWNRSHPDQPPLRLAVNMSLRQLIEPDAIAQLQACLDVSGLAAQELSLEIREDSLSQLGSTVAPTLLALKELGIRLSVDDFGTGASSLLALQRYQLNELKIDRAFVAQMDGDGDAAAIVRGVVRLAKSLGLETVAAGVERPAQEDMLRALGCRAAQGWLYSRPGGDLGTVVASADRSLARERSDDPSPIGTGASTAAIGDGSRDRGVLAERDGDQSLHRAHATLAQRATELAEANDRLRMFASTVAHDLMQPVAAMAGFLSLLDRGLDPGDERRPWLEGAVRGKDRLMQALDALHRHASSPEIPLVPVDLATLAADVAAGFDLELGDGRIELDELPLVEADSGLVVQVLANLLQNAARYRHADRPLVVQMSSVKHATECIVTVADNGRGIHAGELEDVFNAGARGAAATGTAGTGLGLATVRSLMSRMGGDAWAEADEAPGARICLRFRQASPDSP